MFALFSVAILVIVLLVMFMFFILKGTVKKINSQTKLYFVDKLQEYDYLINQKEEKLNQINQEIQEKEKLRVEDSTSAKKKTYEFDYQIIDLLNKTKYQDKNIFELNKKIEEKFIINYEDLLKDFLSNIKDNNKYDFTLKLRNKFTPDEIYKIETLLPEERDKYLKELLTDEEYKVYEIFVISNKFNMVDFIDYLNRLIELNNPTVTVLVPNKNINYDYIDSKIKTKVSDNIYRGIKIIYKNKVYDFSLNEGNV